MIYNSLSFKFVAVRCRTEIRVGRWCFPASLSCRGAVLFPGQPVSVHLGWLSFPLLFLNFISMLSHFFRWYCSKSSERERGEGYSGGAQEAIPWRFLPRPWRLRALRLLQLDFPSGALWFRLVVVIFAHSPLKFFLDRSIVSCIFGHLIYCESPLDFLASPCTLKVTGRCSGSCFGRLL